MKVGSPAQPMSLGPYEILGLIGEGGGGQVHRAWDPRLEREVALKILREPAGSDPERLRRFIAEARAASALNHPNIVTVFDAAVDGDTPYIVSELIDGSPLRADIDRGPVPIKRLLDLATQIADGLAAAHEAGITHRDIKPENIMVTRTGRVKIVDFGLARPGGFDSRGAAAATDELQTQTELGLRAGTVPYMSPEQARGLPTDSRSDQFSFGLVLYEMAAGRAAFRRDTAAATLDAIINDDLPPMSADSRTPLLLRWIIERCLAKEPGERYGVTSDLHRDLRTLRDRLAEAVSRDAVAARPAGTTMRRRVVVGSAAIVALAAGAMLPALVAGPTPGDLSAPHFAPLATEPGFEGFPAWSPDGQTIAYVAEVNDTLQVFTRRLSSAGSAQVTHAAYDCKHPFWSPDGKRIYYISLAADRESIWSISAAGGTAQVVIEDASRGAISPDDRTLAFLRDDEPGDIVGTAALWLSSPVGAEPRRYAPPFGSLRFVEGALAFSPDGTKLGVSAVPRSINVQPDARGWQFWIVPMSGGQPYRRLQWWSDAAPRVSNFAWLPDSRHVVLGMASLSTPGSHLWMADLDRDHAWSLTRGPGSDHYPSVSPNGEQVVFATGDPDYDLVETSVAGGALRPLLATARNESDPVWSPDGNLFAYVTDRNGQDEIWLRTREGRWVDQPLVTQNYFGGDDRTIMLSSPSFSPDGQRIAYQRNAQAPMRPLQIWISQTAGGPPVPLLAPTRQVYQGAPSWSPDGQWIAYTEWTEKEWKLAKVQVGSGEDPIVLRTDGVPNATPHWSQNDWITWETERGFVLVSPDGKQERQLSDTQWLVHTWSRDGSAVLGIRETEDLRLALVSIDVRTRQERILADLGPSPPVNNPVKGFSLSADGSTITTSIVRLRGDLWLLNDLRSQDRPSWRFWPFRSP